MNAVSIIDYGVGNLLSVARAFHYFGAKVNLVNTPDEILKAERIVLPGVGAFQDGMKGLREFNLVDPIKEYAKSGKPFLGICLGMQMMLTESSEFGEHLGLDLIGGEVEPIPSKGINGVPHKIPHIGWNELAPTEHGGLWSESILKNIPQSSSVYFVHSYRVIPSNPKTRLADTYYNGQFISAVIKSDNVYGCQFHPEKSGGIGLKIVEQFLQI